jgi:phosphomevalonate kinase
MKAIAPGKLVILGEYAVVEGAPGLVIAIDHGVACVAELADTLEITTPNGDDRFVRHALRAAQAPTGTYNFSATTQLNIAGKPGFGGSAAATVCATLIAHAMNGTSPTQSQLFAESIASHRLVQGSGSGIDVAASVCGGWVVYEADPPQFMNMPGSLQTPVVVYSGQAARTGPRVATYLQTPRPLRRLFVKASESLITAFLIDPIEAVRDARRILLDVMASAGVDYDTPALSKICDQAELLGGAAKPSGAGGGDCAIALFPDDGARRDYISQMQALGFAVIPAQLSGPAHV